RFPTRVSRLLYVISHSTQDTLYIYIVSLRNSSHSNQVAFYLSFHCVIPNAGTSTSTKSGPTSILTRCPLQNSGHRTLNAYFVTLRASTPTKSCHTSIRIMPANVVAGRPTNIHVNKIPVSMKQIHSFSDTPQPSIIRVYVLSHSTQVTIY
ncbi:unnamed protein product, partial [Laminaria digitata]